MRNRAKLCQVLGHNPRQRLCAEPVNGTLRQILWLTWSLLLLSAWNICLPQYVINFCKCRMTSYSLFLCPRLAGRLHLQSTQVKGLSTTVAFYRNFCFVARLTPACVRTNGTGGSETVSKYLLVQVNQVTSTACKMACCLKPPYFQCLETWMC